MNKVQKEAVITVRTSEDLRNAAKSALAARGDTFQSFLEHHLETLVSGPDTALLQSRRAVPVDGLSRQMRPYIEMAAEILASGNAVAVDALTKNIEAFLKLVRMSAQEHKARPPRH